MYVCPFIYAYIHGLLESTHSLSHACTFILLLKFLGFFFYLKQDFSFFEKIKAIACLYFQREDMLIRIVLRYIIQFKISFKVKKEKLGKVRVISKISA